MRTSFSFKSDESSSAPFIFGADSHGFNQIIIDGRWLYRDFRSKSPSYHLSKILQLSSVCITTADEKESLFYIDKNKCDIEKNILDKSVFF